MVNCVHYMYGMFGFVEKLNIQNRINFNKNCVHNMYRFSGFEKKNWISRNAKNWVRLYVQNI